MKEAVDGGTPTPASASCRGDGRKPDAGWLGCFAVMGAPITGA